MTTLTRILLNPARRAGRKYLTETNALHAAVRSTFPPDIQEDEARVLWRVDSHEHTHTLYIVGPEKPTADGIVAEAGWETRPAQSADYTRFLDGLIKSQRWRFELVANPTYSERREGKRGKIKAHVSPRHQLDWLYKKADLHGFALAPRTDDEASEQERERWSALEQTGVVQRWTDVFHKNRQDGTKGNPVRIVKARFAGTLEVTEPEALRHALTHGIGRARGYGCGLMTLAPVK
ncbi:type I-E CRISPR-associated protein Cas6/Cse3/CasE [Corynebacterium renale]|uniref:type I-E CRISPR-associated protein Cas6/Cse3/CasE n=1 Tax=Corynebacterium renale TaxID=1724 RepID=UPI000652D1FE|nr:type I-E CRISPR-associated protein Cas6/Cse3/CasE [Corynebacterium renale]